MNEESKLTDKSSLLKQAFLALQEAQAKLDAVEHRNREPVAIVGMGCRFPGGPVDAETFWELLREGRDAVVPVPPDRWDIEEYYDPDPDKAGKMIAREAGFLQQRVDGFDAQFFGIAPREAANIDPQQRLALEVAWETLENSGYSPAGLHGTKTGVFLGIASRDYGQLVSHDGDPEKMDGHYAMGVSHSVASGRISYILGLEGPSISIDTACSSSLVAVHLACQSLRAGDSTLALAGGVNLMLSPETTVSLSRLKMLSPSGSCKTFDEDADGFARGEGCGFIALKLLSKALGDGDRILAVVRGSAVNQDGASSSLTAPNGPSQIELMRQALANGGVQAHEVSYIEAHGTGTPLGDPIELQAVGAVYGVVRGTDAPPLAVGSLKTNFGHLEAAAGIAGLMKVVLALQHRQIPAHLHLNKPTSHVQWNKLRLTVPRQLTGWKIDSEPKHGPRIAAVSSFGYSGTNAHIVIAEAQPLDLERENNGWPAQLLTVSAKTKNALQSLAGQYRNFLEKNPETDLRDFCFTANAGRAHFRHRACFVASSTNELAKQLFGFDASHDTKSATAPRIGFLFTGQGSQYPGMGCELYDSSKTFRNAMERCDQAWRRETGESLIDVFYPVKGEPDKLEHAMVAQPALYAFEIALAEMWRNWGVAPNVVLGHSLGEYAAAAVAGVFSVEDGLRLVAARARLMENLQERGTMRAVSATADRVREVLKAHAGEVEIAVINGPEAVVISGVEAAVVEAAAELEEKKIRTRALPVTHGFHSPVLGPILDEFERIAAEIQYKTPRIRMILNLTGEAAKGDEMATARYWREQMRRTVQFDAALKTLLQTGCNAFLEIGPQPHLLSLGQSATGKSATAWLPSARRGRNAWLDILNSVQTLYGMGVELNWKAFHGKSGRPIALPTYPFERQPYWFARKSGTDVQAARRAENGHPLLGTRLQSPLSEIQFESRIGPAGPAYLSDHRVAGHRVVAAAAYLEMALSAAKSVTGKSGAIRSAVFLQPCIFDEPCILQCVLRGEASGQTFSIYSRAEASSGQEWILHAMGEIGACIDNENERVDFGTVRKHCDEESDAAAFYRAFEDNNVQFGPYFRPVKRIFRGAGTALIEFEVPADVFEAPAGVISEATQYQIHPVALDACFQAAVALIPMPASGGQIYLPAALESLEILGDPKNLAAAHGQIRGGNPARNGEPLTAEILGLDREGNVILRANGLMMRPLKQDDSIANCFYEVDWMPIPEDSKGTVDLPGTVVLCGPGKTTASLAAALNRSGIECNMVSATSECGVDGPIEWRERLRTIQQQRTKPISDFFYVAPGLGDIAAMNADALMEAEKSSLGECLAIARALVELNLDVPPRLWIVTRGAQGPGATDPAHSTLWGFGRALALEHPEMRVTCIDLDPAGKSNAAILQCICAAGENEFAVRGETIYVPRLRSASLENEVARQDPTDDTVNRRVELVRPGTLEGIDMVSSERRKPGAGEVEVQVAATGMNFRDVLNVLGMYKGKSGPLGGECAGVITRVGPDVAGLRPGDEVVAIASGCFANFTIARAEFVLQKPANMSFEDAVTIPIAFLTAWYALKTVANIQPGEQVLIHAGAGGVGLAAIQIALRAGAIVYSTAGNAEKRTYLESLGVKKAMDSRSLNFVDEIREETWGRGVDIVLNSLAGPFIDASMDVLAPGGRFVELGMADVRSEESVAQRWPDILYRSFNLAPALEAGDRFVREILDAIWAEVNAGDLRPLPRTIFSLKKSRDAFRYMAQARHIGRVVICPRRAVAMQIVRKDGAYLVTGGFSGVGLEVTKWLAASGAGQVIAMGRTPANAETQKIFHSLRESGTIVSECRGDVSREEDVAAALAHAEKFPLRGVFHCAGVLDDGAMMRQNWERFDRVLAPKAAGAWNLHTATKNLSLDHFVLFSSVAGVFGSPGQTNYAAANAFLDAIASERHSQGLPALSIDWGAWSGTGMAQRTHIAERKHGSGIVGFSTSDGLRMLELSMKSGRPGTIAARIDWDAYLGSAGAQTPRAFLSELRMSRSAQPQTASQKSADVLWLPRLEAVSSEKRKDLLHQLLEERVQSVLGIPSTQEIDPAQPLQELGLDSLLSIELRNSLGQSIGRNLPATLLFNYPTLSSLAQYLSAQFLSAEIDGENIGSRQERVHEKASVSLLDEIEALSDEEIDRLLSAKVTGGVQ